MLAFVMCMYAFATSFDAMPPDIKSRASRYLENSPRKHFKQTSLKNRDIILNLERQEIKIHFRDLLTITNISVDDILNHFVTNPSIIHWPDVYSLWSHYGRYFLPRPVMIKGHFQCPLTPLDERIVASNVYMAFKMIPVSRPLEPTWTRNQRSAFWMVFRFCNGSFEESFIAFRIHELRDNTRGTHVHAMQGSESEMCHRIEHLFQGKQMSILEKGTGQVVRADMISWCWYFRMFWDVWVWIFVLLWVRLVGVSTTNALTFIACLCTMSYLINI